MNAEFDPRGTGRTTLQLKTAPRNAVFVWCMYDLLYPIQLAKDLGREDLQIVNPYWITMNKYKGQQYSAIVLDHDLRLKEHEYESYKAALAYIRKPG